MNLPFKIIYPWPPERRGVLSAQGPSLSPTGLRSVLDLSAQAILYEVATVIYMVRLWGCLCHARHPGLHSPLPWGHCGRGQAATPGVLP